MVSLKTPLRPISSMRRSGVCGAPSPPLGPSEDVAVSTILIPKNLAKMGEQNKPLQRPIPITTFNGFLGAVSYTPIRIS